MRRPLVAALLVVAILLLFAWTSILVSDHTKEKPGSEVKWRTEYRTVDKWRTNYETTETTVFKKRPGVTTWIIVCGKKETTVRGDKPFTECNLPDTSGGG